MCDRELRAVHIKAKSFVFYYDETTRINELPIINFIVNRKSPIKNREINHPKCKTTRSQGSSVINLRVFLYTDIIKSGQIVEIKVKMNTKISSII